MNTEMLPHSQPNPAYINYLDSLWLHITSNTSDQMDADIPDIADTSKRTGPVPIRIMDQVVYLDPTDEEFEKHPFVQFWHKTTASSVHEGELHDRAWAGALAVHDAYFNISIASILRQVGLKPSMAHYFDSHFDLYMLLLRHGYHEQIVAMGW